MAAAAADRTADRAQARADRLIRPAAARWAAISLLQGDRFIQGGERSLELALTGLMPPEMEWDALDIIDRLAAKGRVT